MIITVHNCKTNGKAYYVRMNRCELKTTHGIGLSRIDFMEIRRRGGRKALARFEDKKWKTYDSRYWQDLHDTVGKMLEIFG